MNTIIKSFFEAIESKDISKIHQFLNHGLDIRDMRNQYGFTPLMLAIDSKNREIIDTILKYTRNLEERDYSGNTALIWAADIPNLEFMRALIEKGANINAQNNDGNTPLHYVMYHQHKECLEYLLQHGVKLDISRKDGWNILDFYRRRCLRSSIEFSNCFLNAVYSKYAALVFKDKDKYIEFLNHFSNHKDLFELFDLLLDNKLEQAREQAKGCWFEGFYWFYISRFLDEKISLKKPLNTELVDCIRYFSAKKAERLITDYQFTPEQQEKLLTLFPNNSKFKELVHLSRVSTMLKEEDFLGAKKYVLQNELKQNSIYESIYRKSLEKYIQKEFQEKISKRISNLIDPSFDILLEIFAAEHFNTEQRKTITSLFFKMEYEELNVLYNYLKEYNFIQADAIASKLEKEQRDEYIRMKIPFVKQYFKEVLCKKSDILLPDDEQINAISDPTQNILITARAGAGKTATIVNRVIFGVEGYGLVPEQIKILAFNRNARSELNNRLSPYALDMASTFHSLAWHIYTKCTGISPNVIDLDSKKINAKSNLITKIVEDMMGQAPWREQYYQIIRNESVFLQDGELLAPSLLGGKARALAVKYIADFFFEHQLTFAGDDRLEFRFGGYLWRKTKADFISKNKINGKNIYIVYSSSESLESDFKARHSNRQDILIQLDQEFSHEELKDRQRFEKYVEDTLRCNGITSTPISHEELVDIFYEEKHYKSVAGLVKTLIDKYQQKNWNDREQVLLKINQYNEQNPSNSFKAYLKLSLEAYDRYITKLGKDIDFNILLQKVALLLAQLSKEKELSQGEKEIREEIKKWKLLAIDEFQDFSALFFDIIKQIKHINPDIKLLCVGDDWQSINEFAGADTYFFDNFCTLIQDCFHQEASSNILTTNYRCDPRVVAIANDFMKKCAKRNGPVGKGNSSNQTSADVIYEQQFHGKENENILDSFYKSISEDFETLSKNHVLMGGAIFNIILNTFLTDGDCSSSFLIMSRNNELVNIVRDVLDKYIDFNYSSLLSDLYEYLKINNKIEFKTVHKVKGSQANVCIILFDDDSSFPSLSGTNRLTDELFEIDAEKQEENLFYVALTRAKVRKDIMSQGKIYLLGSELDISESKYYVSLQNIASIKKRKVSNIYTQYRDVLDRLFREELMKKPIQKELDENMVSITEHPILRELAEKFFFLKSNNLYCVAKKKEFFFYLNNYFPNRDWQNHRDSEFSGRIIGLKGNQIEDLQWYADKLSSVLSGNFVAVAVPSSQKGKKSPMSDLVDLLSAKHHITNASSCLRRVKSIKKLARGNNRDVSVHLGSISIESPELLDGKNILLLDDIISTGNSLRACEQIIRKYSNPSTILKFALGKTTES